MPIWRIRDPLNTFWLSTGPESASSIWSLTRLSSSIHLLRLVHIQDLLFAIWVISCMIFPIGRKHFLGIELGWWLWFKQMWPNWTIFERSCLQIFLQKKHKYLVTLGLFWKIALVSKFDIVTFWAFWKIWATFYSLIWSHWFGDNKFRSNYFGKSFSILIRNTFYKCSI